MLEFIQRNKATFLLFVYSFLSLVFLSLQLQPYVAGLKSVTWFLLSPQVVHTSRFFSRLDSLSGRMFQLARAEGENILLREQVAQLSKRELERQSLERENEELRRLLQLRQMTFPNAIPAEVLSGDMRGWFHFVVIDKGRRDGVVPSAAVAAETGRGLVLVGRVHEVSEDNSKVMLVTDAASAVSVEVERSGAIGLLEGRNGPGLMMTYISQQADVREGDRLFSAGLGGVFPRGVMVGEVGPVRPMSDGFFREAPVELFMDAPAVRRVLILQRGEAGGAS